MSNGLHKTILSLFAGIVSEFDRVDRKRHGRLVKAIAEALSLTDSAGGETGGTGSTGSGMSTHLNELRLEALGRAPLTQKGFLWGGPGATSRYIGATSVSSHRIAVGVSKP